LKPVIVEHSFGEHGSGGPVTALERLLASRLADDYTFVRMHQARAAGGINLPLLREWVAILRAARPDIVHVRGLGNEGFHGALAARLAGCPNILVSIHGTVRDLTQANHPIRRGVLVRLLEPATLRLATDIVVVCKAMEQRPFLDPVRHKVREIIYNGVEIPALTLRGSPNALRTELGLAPDQVALVTVGRLSVEKGHLDLSRALALCDEAVLAKVVLVLVGDGPDRDAILEAYSQVPHLKVRALGRRHDVVAVLQASDVFVFPTLHENLSNALLEAMSVGMPVVATAVGGNVEVLSGGGGLLVAPGDHAALAAAIRELTLNASRRAELGLEAREVVRSAFSLDHMIAAWDRCYQAVLSRNLGR